MAYNQRLIFLLEQVGQGTAGAEEYQELRSLINSDASGDIVQQVNDFHANGVPAMPAYDFAHWQRVVREVLDADKQSIAPVIPDSGKDGPPIHHLPFIYRRRWWAAAAVVLLAAGIYLWQKPVDRIPAVTGIQQSADVKAPMANRARITLAGGQEVYLDSAGNGQLAQQGGVQLVKLADGKVSYSGASSETVYNTLTNPRGSNVINIRLSDGTRVWLNAGSAIHFPVSFNGHERRVSVTGEAYFEVANNTAMPFSVQTDDGSETEVLGTYFNVNAFRDDNRTIITLLEGAVKVSANNGSHLLKPGQQALVGDKLKVADNADLDAVMAWKNGKFIFQDVNIQSIMKQLSRWYDVDVSYEGPVTDEEFVGVIARSRYENISQILELIEKTKTVSFKVSGRRVIVTAFSK